MSFENQKMDGTTFHNVNLSDSEFDDVDLSGAKFHNINLSNARFTDVNLSHVTIDESCVSGLKIQGVDVEAAVKAALEKRDSTTARLTGATPVLPARNMKESVAFYVEKMGFLKTFDDDGENPTYCGLTRDGISIHLFAFEDKTYADNTMVRFAVHNIETLFAQYSAHNIIHPNGSLQVKPWGSTEFSVVDPAGVCITFVGQVICSAIHRADNPS